MARVLRTSLSDGYFHVFIRGVCDIPPFPAAQDRTAALGMLMKSAARFEIEVLAVSVMTTHYHAMVEGACGSLSAAMQLFHSRYARGYNKRYGRYGHVFAERFRCRVVEEDGVFDRCGYVVGNPVKAGLCDRIGDWPWSWCRYGLDAF